MNVAAIKQYDFGWDFDKWKRTKIDKLEMDLSLCSNKKVTPRKINIIFADKLVF